MFSTLTFFLYKIETSQVSPSLIEATKVLQCMLHTYSSSDTTGKVRKYTWLLSIELHSYIWQCIVSTVAYGLLSGVGETKICSLCHPCSKIFIFKSFKLKSMVNEAGNTFYHAQADGTNNFLTYKYPCKTKITVKMG